MYTVHLHIPKYYYIYNYDWISTNYGYILWSNFIHVKIYQNVIQYTYTFPHSYILRISRNTITHTYISHSHVFAESVFTLVARAQRGQTTDHVTRSTLPRHAINYSLWGRPTRLRAVKSRIHWTMQIRLISKEKRVMHGTFYNDVGKCGVLFQLHFFKL